MGHAKKRTSMCRLAGGIHAARRSRRGNTALNRPCFGGTLFQTGPVPARYRCGHGSNRRLSWPAGILMPCGQGPSCESDSIGGRGGRAAGARARAHRSHRRRRRVPGARRTRYRRPGGRRRGPCGNRAATGNQRRRLHGGRQGGIGTRSRPPGERRGSGDAGPGLRAGARRRSSARRPRPPSG